MAEKVKNEELAAQEAVAETEALEAKAEGEANEVPAPEAGEAEQAEAATEAPAAEETAEPAEPEELPEAEAAKAAEEPSDAAEETSEETPVPAEECEKPAVEVPAEGDPNTIAQRRVLAAKLQVQSAEEEIEECIHNIQKDLEEFEAYERASLLPVVEESQKLLEAIGMEEAAIEPTLAELELENPIDEKLEIRELSSGKGGAFFWGFLGALATVAGWYGYAVGKAGAPLVPQKVPDIDSLSALAGKISLLVGPTENPSVGAAMVIGSALVVWWFIYMVLVSMRASKNRRIAEEIEEQAGFFCQKKEECKAMMEKVREHLQTLGQTARKYEVLLAEKNAGLRRALYIEEAKEFDQLHAKSQEMAREIEAMLKELDRLLGTPMARSGILTEESVEALRHAKRVINDQILRLYS